MSSTYCVDVADVEWAVEQGDHHGGGVAGARDCGNKGAFGRRLLEAHWQDEGTNGRGACRIRRRREVAARDGREVFNVAAGDRRDR